MRLQTWNWIIGKLTGIGPDLGMRGLLRLAVVWFALRLAVVGIASSKSIWSALWFVVEGVVSSKSIGSPALTLLGPWAELVAAAG